MAWLARGARLPQADIADAQAQAALAIHEAALKYLLGGDPKRAEGRWKQFVKKVIGRRIENFTRAHRHAERGLDRHLHADEVPRERCRCRGQPREEDPARLAARAEVLARLSEAVERLPDLDRRVAAGLMEGKPEVRIAAELGITRGRIRGRIAQIGAWLKPYLRDLEELLNS